MSQGAEHNGASGLSIAEADPGGRNMHSRCGRLFFDAAHRKRGRAGWNIRRNRNCGERLRRLAEGQTSACGAA
jgi:hypothetical protein